jgi:hypothetical protein
MKHTRSILLTYLKGIDLSCEAGVPVASSIASTAAAHRDLYIDDVKGGEKSLSWTCLMGSRLVGRCLPWLNMWWIEVHRLMLLLLLLLLLLRRVFRSKITTTQELCVCRFYRRKESKFLSKKNKNKNVREKCGKCEAKF